MLNLDKEDAMLSLDREDALALLEAAENLADRCHELETAIRSVEMEYTDEVIRAIGRMQYCREVVDALVVRLHGSGG